MSGDGTHVERYRGVITERPHGEGDDILFLDSEAAYDSDPLAERVKDDIDRHGHYLAVRYWTADEPLSDDAMIEGAIREAIGAGEAKFHHAYSEVTGYLWTDEEINVGGHDLIEELQSQKGRYCLLEISYRDSPRIYRAHWRGHPTHNFAGTPGDLEVTLWGYSDMEPGWEVALVLTEKDVPDLVAALERFGLL